MIWITLALLLFTAPLIAQTRPFGTVPPLCCCVSAGCQGHIDRNEAVGGALWNSAIRVLLPYRDHDPIFRFMVFTAGSKFYEQFLDKSHPGNSIQADWDVRDRMVGYLIAELGAVLWNSFIVRHT